MLPHRTWMLLLVFHALVAAFVFPSRSSGDMVMTYIGDAGNDPDYAHPIGPPYDLRYHGAVDYDYLISTYEVTVSQYVEFLNAAAKTDPYGLYNYYMGEGGALSPAIIIRSGEDGSYTYTAVSGTENQPVRYVSFYDGLRLCNWLHNGKGDGDTETGSYDLILGEWVTRSEDATWVLPSEDEWYKAAYYDPINECYYNYPNGSNETPAEPTDESTPRDMNFGDSPYWQGNVYFTSIGETTGSSPYGVYDMGGNVEEWTDSFPLFGGGSDRITRGGDFASDASYLSYNGGVARDPSLSESTGTGLRLVYLIPEPGTIGLALLGFLTIKWYRRSKWPR